MKIGVSMSGGATKIAGILASLQVLKEYGIKPCVYSGVSSGAIMAFAAATGNLEKSGGYILNMKPKDVFSILPMYGNGCPTPIAVWRLITLKNSLGSMNALRKTIKKVISKESFEEYRNDPDSPDAIVMFVNISNAKREFVNLKDVDYDKAIECVMASSSIPGIVKPVKIDGEMYYDGGLRDHTISQYILENYDLDEHYSIYTRPEYLNDYTKEMNIPKYVISVLLRSILIYSLEISKSDEKVEDLLALQNNVNNTKIYMPRVLKSTYDMNIGRLRELYERVLDDTRDVMKKKFNIE